MFRINNLYVYTSSEMDCRTVREAYRNSGLEKFYGLFADTYEQVKDLASSQDISIFELEDIDGVHFTAPYKAIDGRHKYYMSGKDLGGISESYTEYDSNNFNESNKEVNVMTGNVNDMFKTMMSMKMMNSVMKDSDQDLGKLFLMQQLASGETIQITDVIKAKLIKQFNLDKDGDDLPIEKVLLLQMLDSGTLDISQLVAFKMLGKMFDTEFDTDKE